MTSPELNSAQCDKRIPGCNAGVGLAPEGTCIAWSSFVAINRRPQLCGAALYQLRCAQLIKIGNTEGVVGSEGDMELTATFSHEASFPLHLLSAVQNGSL